MESNEGTTMQTLPVEILEKIIKQLTVKDLASCSCVSRQWREMLNQDWVWTPHYDHHLEESLRTTPCMTTQPFERPEHPALPSVCRSKLAVMMEKRLWKNWRRYSSMYVKEIKPSSHYTTLDGIDFLTDKLILMLSSKGMDILDVSVTPTELVASDNYLYHIPGTRRNFIFRGFSNRTPDDGAGRESLIGTLLDIREWSLVIYSIDPIEKSILLEHNIVVLGMIDHCVTGDFYVVLNYNSSLELTLFDLNTERKWNVSVPMDETEDIVIVDYKLIKSESNDFVVVCLLCKDLERNVVRKKHHIFSLERLVFLPSPVLESQWSRREPESNIVLLRQYLVFYDQDRLTIMDFSTENVLLTRTRMSTDGIPIVFNDAFVFLDHENEATCLMMFNPESKKLTTLFRCEDSRFTEKFRIIKVNKKFLGLFYISSLRFEILWEILGQSVKKSNTDTEYLSKCVLTGAKINQSFTKVIFKEEKNGTLPGYSGCSFLGDCLSSNLLDIIPPQPRLHFGRFNNIHTKWCIRNFW